MPTSLASTPRTRALKPPPGKGQRRLQRQRRRPCAASWRGPAGERPTSLGDVDTMHGLAPLPAARTWALRLHTIYPIKPDSQLNYVSGLPVVQLTVRFSLGFTLGLAFPLRLASGGVSHIARALTKSRPSIRNQATPTRREANLPRGGAEVGPRRCRRLCISRDDTGWPRCTRSSSGQVRWTSTVTRNTMLIDLVDLAAPEGRFDLLAQGWRQAMGSGWELYHDPGRAARGVENGDGEELSARRVLLPPQILID